MADSKGIGGGRLFKKNVNTHDYRNLGYCIPVAENSIDTIKVRVRTLNTSSGRRCWEVSKKVLGVNTPLLEG